MNETNELISQLKHNNSEEMCIFVIFEYID